VRGGWSEGCAAGHGGQGQDEVSGEQQHWTFLHAVFDTDTMCHGCTRAIFSSIVQGVEPSGQHWKILLEGSVAHWHYIQTASSISRTTLNNVPLILCTGPGSGVNNDQHCTALQAAPGLLDLLCWCGSRSRRSRRSSGCVSAVGQCVILPYTSAFCPSGENSLRFFLPMTLESI
jgi:hypothetical protein